LTTRLDQAFAFDLPDPTRRKALEYYRDRAKRGYLSYQVKEGHTPSLYFRTPGTGVMRTRADGQAAAKGKEGAGASDRMW
jgi:large subunit ribosomal protein L15